MKNFLFWGFIAVLVFIVLFLGYGFALSSTPDGKKQNEERFAISYCRDNAKKDSKGDAGIESLLMGACDRMAEDYRLKYGVNP